MDLEELKHLDIKNIAAASMPIKIGILAIICAAILGAGYYFDTQHQIQELKKVEEKEVQLLQNFEMKQKKAANLKLYQQQLEEMRRSFGAMLRQLPSKTEIPGLIVDISQTGLASGLEIDLFKPSAAVNKGFYEEKPIELTVKGSYHEFGKFASRVAALPRIVTLHNISLAPPKELGDMTMKATAKTYRYLDEQGGG